MCIGLGIVGLPELSKKCHFGLAPNWVLARYCLWKYYLQVSGPLVGADVSGCSPCQKKQKKLFRRYELSQVTHPRFYILLSNEGLVRIFPYRLLSL